MDNIELYLKFRQEIDKIVVPELLKVVTPIKIIKDDKDVGILCYIRQDEWVYIDAVYVIPEYRHQGVAKNSILNWYEDFKDEEIRLHIINENKPALKFWNSIFELEVIESDVLEALYRIRGVKV